MRATLITLALVLVSASALKTVSVQQQTSELTANPIRKVVTMLQNMQKKITAEGEKEQKMFDKFMCYCKNSDSTLGASISSGQNKVTELASSITASVAEKAQLEAELKADQTSRVEAKDTMKKATALREKEAKSYANDAAALKANINALGGAIDAISKGMSGAFLQTNTAQMVRKIALSGPSMSDVDRQDLMSFLSAGQGNGYVPASGQITGILKTLKDEMSASLADATTDENGQITSYDGLMSAKTKQVQALTAAIESKSKRVGDLGVKIAMMNNDRDDTAEAVAEDQKFLGDLAHNCATKKGEWDDIVQMRAMEMVALADTIKILNDDDALELFKKTLPSASFLQLATTDGAIRNKALAFIVNARKQGKPALALDFVELALRGKKMGFGKVIKMVDNMVAELKVEQGDDDKKKEYCEMQLDQSDDKKKGLEQKISDLETSIDDAKEGISTTKAELEALDDGIRALDKSVSEATEQRKEEHSDFTELMASNNAAKELLKFAKNRLNKFYNPKLYKPEGASFVQVSMHKQEQEDAPPPPPEAPGAYKKKGEESTGVIAMIDELVKELDTEMTEAETEEKLAQEEYEELMADSAAKRAADSKSITAKENEKANTETALTEQETEHTSSVNELMATEEYISSLHGECDWLIQYYGVRKEARAGEIDSMKKAKAVLSGADFSLMQTRSKKFLRH